MGFHHGTGTAVIAATAYQMTARDSRSDPLAYHQLCSLAAYDGTRLHDVRTHIDEAATKSLDANWQGRALSLIDDTLLHLHGRNAA